MSEEQLEQAGHLADRIMDALDNENKEFTIVADALSVVLVSLFLHQDFDGLSRERALMVFLQETFCRLKYAIDRGEDLSNRTH